MFTNVSFSHWQFSSFPEDTTTTTTTTTTAAEAEAAAEAATTTTAAATTTTTATMQPVCSTTVDTHDPDCADLSQNIKPLTLEAR
jgi:hypothetical protein